MPFASPMTTGSAAPGLPRGHSTPGLRWAALVHTHRRPSETALRALQAEGLFCSASPLVGDEQWHLSRCFKLNFPQVRLLSSPLFKGYLYPFLEITYSHSFSFFYWVTG